MTQPVVRRPGPVGSRKASNVQAYEPYGFEDEVRVQQSMTAVLHHPGARRFYYTWELRYTRTSRVHKTPEDTIEAMRRQGFGAYIDLDGVRIRLKPLSKDLP